MASSSRRCKSAGSNASNSLASVIPYLLYELNDKSELKSFASIDGSRAISFT